MRRNRFPYKKGSIIEIYKDYQTCRELEGMGRLISFKEQGLPFILDEARTSSQVVFAYQIWLVDLDGFRTYRKVRYVKVIGRAASLESYKVPEKEKDSFIKVNGKEVF